MRTRRMIELDQRPRLALMFTDESVFVTRFDERGAPLATYPVSAVDAAAAMNTFGSDTGLLAMDTLFWQQRGGAARIGVWIAPGRRTITYTAGRGRREICAPMPGLVLVGHRRNWFVWAAVTRPQSDEDALYRAPFSNVYPDGRICQGNAPFPECTGETMHEAARVFFESYFSSDLGDMRVRNQQGTLQKFWESLRGAKRFPAGRLIEAGTMGDVREGAQ